jgi:betaine-aldehyde dehydrogenase
MTIPGDMRVTIVGAGQASGWVAATLEIFGPVLAVMPWDDEDELFRDVNSLDLGLSASVWMRSLATAHRMAASGYIWINHTSSHFLGAEFGGYKKSGIGREEGLSELLSYTQVKNVNVALD